jgi:hypothetical protein
VHRVDEPVDVAAALRRPSHQTPSTCTGLVPVDQGSIRPVEAVAERATRKAARLSTDLHLRGHSLRGASACRRDLVESGAGGDAYEVL